MRGTATIACLPCNSESKQKAKQQSAMQAKQSKESKVKQGNKAKQRAHQGKRKAVRQHTESGRITCKNFVSKRGRVHHTRQNAGQMRTCADRSGHSLSGQMHDGHRTASIKAEKLRTCKPASRAQQPRTAAAFHELGPPRVGPPFQHDGFSFSNGRCKNLRHLSKPISQIFTDDRSGALRR